MSMWIVILAALVAWTLVSVAMALVVGRVVRTREHYEAPLFAPEAPVLNDAGAGRDPR